MKHLAISAALVAGLGIAAINPAQAANDGVIEITGEILATTCLVEGQAPGTGGITKEVELKGVNKAALGAAAQRAGAKSFKIKVGGIGDTNCTPGQTAYVRFDPSSPDLDWTTGRLKNSLEVAADPDAATNVEIEMLNGDDGSIIDMFGDDSKGYVIGTDNQAQIPLIAQYYATAAAVEGLVKSTVGFTVVYD